MIYIFCATKSEAQAIVEYKKLKKRKQGALTLFVSDTVTLCVSGVGKEAARKAVNAFKKEFSLMKDDIVLNIGIAAAPPHIPIGSLCVIGRVVTNDKEYRMQAKGETLTCKNEAVSTYHTTLVDMESCVFAEHFLPNLTIYKVVSDHFDPSVVTKEGTKALIAAVLAEIEPLRS